MTHHPTSPPRCERRLAVQVKVQGWLDDGWADWFDGLTIKHHLDANGLGVSTLTGRVVDQAALYGLLNRIFSLGLPLLALNSQAQPVETDKQEVRSRK